MRWWLAFGAASACLAFGLVALAVQALAGDPAGPWGWGLHVTGMRTPGIGGAPWGLYIVGDVFFIGVSFAGTGIGVLTHLFKVPAIKPLGRIAELISILSLAMAGMFVLADQGRPLEALQNLPLFTKPASPFFGTFVLLCTYLFTNLVFFFLDARADAAAMADRGGRFAWIYRLLAAGWKGTPAEQKRHERVCFWLAVTTLIMLIVEQTTAGLIFGTQLGRPGWFSDLLAPGFLALAAVSGIGVLLVVVAILRRFLDLRRQIRLDTFRWLLRALLIMTAINGYFIATEAFKAWYATPESESVLTRELMFGEFAPVFWSMIVCHAAAFGIALWQYSAHPVSIGWAVVAGVVANVGVLLKRLLVVVPSQTHGTLIALDDGVYAPTWVEYGIALGVVSFSVCAYLLFIRVFPIVHESHHELHEAPSAAPAEPAALHQHRLVLTRLILAAGVAIAAVALAASARVGIESYLDPAIPASPMLFILGIALMMASAVVYDAYRIDGGERETPSAGDRLAWSTEVPPDGAADADAQAPVRGRAAKAKKSPLELMALVMRDVDAGVPVAEACRKVGMSEKSFHRYRVKYAGKQPDQSWRLRELEEENLRLRQVLSEETVRNEELRDVVSKKRQW